jgi:hypothetical protein
MMSEVEYTGIEFVMPKTFEEEMQELEDNMASVTIQDSSVTIQDSDESDSTEDSDASESIQYLDASESIQDSVTSIINDLLDDIDCLEPPSKAEVARYRRESQNPEINALLAQIEADMSVVAIANKYESEMAFAESADRVERFVENAKIPTFIQPPVLIRSNSNYDVCGDEFTTVLPEAVAPSPLAPPKMVRSVSQAPAFCPPTPRKAF